ncbi:hypothetical protein TVAG_041710 [Trichomonas vaginalis G3]|uniref:Glycosyltransferase 61 catalytic domain-containing protein n=1 Tax=Trichomonas vaginalis (strain ATCC PRA-98 / G3) TaxID=412133 RepID=A2FEW5_TRIV3|nr:protein of unknown function, DUF563 family [Trichomonas vaginalis G3]EAX96569.1 hypothetical protein TVAG_041710 [Trichomonas vaginalis G3]KAI5509354.1 protein of unknown function, DUF563 family [Trichomonas vaginalis G3]|eukprot:XP_001309499.1 hypothetical protein [Trichomonas vaginalis G3]
MYSVIFYKNKISDLIFSFPCTYKSISLAAILLPIPILLLSRICKRIPQLSNPNSYSNEIRYVFPQLVIKQDLPYNTSVHIIRGLYQDFSIYSPEYIGNATTADLFTLAFATIYYATYENVICRTDLSFYSNNSIYMQNVNCRTRFYNYSSKEHPYIDIKYNSYDNVICIGHQHSSDFGHWMIETFPLMWYIPKSVLNQSVIAIPRISQFVVDCLSILGVKKSSIIYGDDLYFHAKKLHTVTAPYCDYISYQAILNHRKNIVNSLSLDKVKPSRLVFFNRKRGMSRYLANIEMLIEEASRKYTNSTFELGIFYDRIVDQIKYFNEIKLLMAVHGSLMANLIFMQPETYVIEIQMEHIFFCFLRTAIFTGKKVTVVRDQSISYRSIQDNMVNISMAMSALDIVMKNMLGTNTFKRINFDDD